MSVPTLKPGLPADKTILQIIAAHSPPGRFIRLVTLIALPAWSLFLLAVNLKALTMTANVVVALVVASALGLYAGVQFWCLPAQAPVAVKMSSYNVSLKA